MSYDVGCPRTLRGRGDGGEGVNGREWRGTMCRRDRVRAKVRGWGCWEGGREYGGRRGRGGGGLVSKGARKRSGKKSQRCTKFHIHVT